MISIAEFAKSCRVSRAAVYKAGKVGRVRINGGKVNPNAPDSRAYRADVTRQRYQARVDKQIGTGIFRRDGSGKSHRHKSADVVRRERQAQDPCRQVEKCWADGGLPDGWAALCLADVPDEHGFPTPLFFYPPGGGKDNPVFESDSAKAYEVHLKADPAVAIEAGGTRHPLTLRTFGKVPWVERSARSARKSSKESSA